MHWSDTDRLPSFLCHCQLYLLSLFGPCRMHDQKHTVITQLCVHNVPLSSFISFPCVYWRLLIHTFIPAGISLSCLSSSQVWRSSLSSERIPMRSTCIMGAALLHVFDSRRRFILLMEVYLFFIFPSLFLSYSARSRDLPKTTV